MIGFVRVAREGAGLLRATPSLRRRLVLWIMSTVGLALVLVMGAFLSIEMLGSRASARRDLSALAAVLGEGASASLDFGYRDEAERTLATVRAHPGIMAVALYDRHQTLFATYRRPDCTDLVLPSSPQPEASAFEGDDLWVTHPVRHGNDVLGTIYVRSDLSDFHERLRWVLVSALAITALVGLAVLALAARVGRVISRPIMNLATTARRVSEHQDTGGRVARETEDEVGTLVDAFNDMLDRLREREARLEEAQSMAHLGSWSVDARSGRVVCSEELLRILGAPRPEPLADIDALCAFVHPEDRPALRQALEDVRSRGSRLAVDCRIVQPGEALRWVHISARRFGEPPAEPHLRGTLMDITDRRDSESAIRHAQKLESIGVLAGGIAHDFNNLLCAMLGNLGLARLHLPRDSRADPYLGKAETIAHNAAVLTRQMLAYSGKGRFEVRPLDLGQVVTEMGSLIGVAISKKVEVRYDIAPDAPPIVADAAQIQQVVMNLVVNASEAMEGRRGHIRIRTAVLRLADADLGGVWAGQELTAGTYVSLEVADDGHGMDAATMDRIFDPFFTTKFAGRGLGLAALLGIVKGHKGGIRVASDPGKGTTFQVLFPASRAALTAQAVPPAPATFQGSGLAIVADDEPQIRAMACEVLELLGFEVLPATHGADCLDQFRTHRGRVRLVLLDLTMPQMDGAECLRALHQLEPSLPVILSSGFSEQDTMSRLGNEAVFLQKPYVIDTLMAKVAEVMKPRPAAS